MENSVALKKTFQIMKGFFKTEGKDWQQQPYENDLCQLAISCDASSEEVRCYLASEFKESQIKLTSEQEANLERLCECWRAWQFAVKTYKASIN